MDSPLCPQKLLSSSSTEGLIATQWLATNLLPLVSKMIAAPLSRAEPTHTHTHKSHLYVPAPPYPKHDIHIWQNYDKIVCVVLLSAYQSKAENQNCSKVISNSRQTIVWPNTPTSICMWFVIINVTKSEKSATSYWWLVKLDVMIMCWCITYKCAWPYVVFMFPTHLRPGLNNMLNKSVNFKETPSKLVKSSTHDFFVFYLYPDPNLTISFWRSRMLTSGSLVTSLLQSSPVTQDSISKLGH